MRKIKKVPVILQMEAVECGAASLTMILGYYKKYIPLEKMRIECNVTRDGSSAKYIMKAAMRNGLEAKAYKINPEQIRQREDFPMIIHWNFNHFVVLCGFDGEYAVINDPASGRIRVEPDVFDRSFTGIAMCFRPKLSGAGTRPDETGIVFCDGNGGCLQPDPDIVTGIL